MDSSLVNGENYMRIMTVRVLLYRFYLILPGFSLDYGIKRPRFLELKR